MAPSTAAAAVIFLLVAVVSQVSGDAHLYVVNGVSDFKGNNSDLDLYIYGSLVLRGVSYGEGIGYLQVPPGPCTVQVRLTASPRPPYGLTQLVLDDEQHYVVVASGSMTNSSQYVLRLTSEPATGGSNSSLATVAFFNLAPGADALALSVDDNLSQLVGYYPFGALMTQPQFSPGNHAIVVRDAGDKSLMLKTRVKLQAGVNFLFALGNVVGGQALSLRAIQPEVPRTI